jgi:hypothetical protein
MPNEHAPLCECGWLKKEADEPSSHVFFDPKLNEYNIRRGDDGYSRIYHCPFCGGRAPDSKRGHMFAVIDDAERGRLTQLTYPLRTLEQVIAALGQPTEDSFASSTMPESEESPQTVHVYRRLVYRDVSTVANVEVLVMADRLSITFNGKYIGLPEDRAS